LGDWKVVAAGKDAPWELYDLTADRSESANLAAEKPEKVRELSALWSRRTEEYDDLARQKAPSEKDGKPGEGVAEKKG
jgi:arylsulfatase